MLLVLVVKDLDHFNLIVDVHRHRKMRFSRQTIPSCTGCYSSALALVSMERLMCTQVYQTLSRAPASACYVSVIVTSMKMYVRASIE